MAESGWLQCGGFCSGCKAGHAIYGGYKAYYRREQAAAVEALALICRMLWSNLGFDAMSITSLLPGQYNREEQAEPQPCAG